MMPFPEPLRPLAATTDRPVGPEVIRDLLTLESSASAGGFYCNQQLSYRLLITIATHPHAGVSVCYSVTEQLQSAGTTCASKKSATRL
jgi:hypothetical protein